MRTRVAFRSSRPSRGFRVPRLAALGGMAAVAAVGLSLPDLSKRAAAAEVRVTFGLCPTGGGRNCVVDGDTFRLGGERIRVADIDAPETHPPRCAREARLGAAATHRLRALLNQGPVVLVRADRDTDRYGRKLRIVTRDGASLGEKLVEEGLARRWGGARRPWC